jgi:uncharacterized Tic20 family protein
MTDADQGRVPPPIPPVSYAGPAGLEMNKDARLWGMLAHLAALAGHIIPLGNIVGPLVVWLIKKDEFPFADEQGKESLNFQITVSIALVACIILAFAVVGIFLIPVVMIASLIFVIIAAVKANSGEHYRYPISIRFIN